MCSLTMFSQLVMDLNDMNSIPYLKAQIDNYQTMLPQARSVTIYLAALPYVYVAYTRS